MLILGIETSCDETATAVVADGYKVLSNVVSSQVKIHSEFGGVVPELASRSHLENIIPVVDESLREAGVGWTDIDGIAVTRGPGLIGCLLVGLCYAKSVAYARGLPLCGVNHLEGHLLSITLEQHDIDFPFVSLVVSGGHTNLYLAEDVGRYRQLGRSRDDAAGEAFDKVARLLDLGYPGGTIIENKAKGGNTQAIRFPRGMIKDSLDFSFSGLKTSVRNYVNKLNKEEVRKGLKDILASFQEAVVDVLVTKALRAARELDIKSVVVSGGVAANLRLRELFDERSDEEGVKVYFPSRILCTDNAAMIACAGYHYLKDKADFSLDLDAEANLKLG